MNKNTKVILIAVFVLLAILFVPIPQGSYDDGGTREYIALTYKIVDWNRITPDGVYENIKVYFFGDKNKSIDELWEMEADYVPQKFLATIVELDDTSVLVEPLADEFERRSSDKISFGTADLEQIGAQVGSVVEITYFGGIMEKYPAAIDASSWQIAKDLRHLEYTQSWLDKQSAQARDNNFFQDIVITQIYSNCFFARTVVPMPYQIKLNGTLSDDWCVGDQIIATYENTYFDEINQRIEADMIAVEASEFELDPYAAYKPVIYLYPEQETQVSVKLTLEGKLTCTYPAYQNGWNVTTSPDGTLTDAQGQTYNYLYWEGEMLADYDLSKGFCVKGEDTAAFLEDALAKLGLTRREANEFIVYWLPLMQTNPYNIISFQTDSYTDAARLDIEPAPDTVIRVFMTWQASDSLVEPEEQVLTAPERNGFTVVEWGGTELTVD